MQHIYEGCGQMKRSKRYYGGGLSRGLRGQDELRGQELLEAHLRKTHIVRCQLQEPAPWIHIRPLIRHTKQLVHAHHPLVLTLHRGRQIK